VADDITAVIIVQTHPLGCSRDVVFVCMYMRMCACEGKWFVRVSV